MTSYECGCLLEQAGQSFDHGLLVCPEHRSPVAPWDRVEPPARARVMLELELEGPSQAGLEGFADGLVESLLARSVVRAVTVVREELVA